MARFTTAFNKLSALVSTQKANQAADQAEIKEAKEAYDCAISERRNKPFEKPKKVFNHEKDAILLSANTNFTHANM